MVTPSFPNVWYWRVLNNNPLTSVWEGTTGQLVANNSANYLSWVANGGTSFGPVNIQAKVTNVSNNGSGACRLAVSTTNGMINNDPWVVQNTGTSADGTF